MLDKAKSTALDDIRSALKGGMAARLKAKHAPPPAADEPPPAEGGKPQVLHVTAVKVAPHAEPDADEAGGPDDGDSDAEGAHEDLRAALGRHLSSLLPGHHKR